MRRYAAVLIILAAAAAPVSAQFSADRVFGYLDSDRNGTIDSNEASRAQGPMRDLLQRSGGRSVGRDEFSHLFEESMQARREQGGGGGRGGFGPGGFGPGGSRDGDSEDRRSERDGSGRNRTSGVSGPSRSHPPRERVTVELLAKYTEGDRDGDGQLGLYEWIEWKTRVGIGEFLAMDLNRDGFLEPRELVIAERKTAGNGGSGSNPAAPGGSRTPGASTSGAPSSSVPAAGGGRLDEQGERYARWVFSELDRDDDERLSLEEWQRSNRTRQSFQAAGAQLEFPADVESFVAQFPPSAVRSDGGGSDNSGSGNNNSGGDERERTRGPFGRGR